MAIHFASTLLALMAASPLMCMASASCQGSGLCASDEQDSVSFYQRVVSFNQRSPIRMDADSDAERGQCTNAKCNKENCPSNPDLPSRNDLKEPGGLDEVKAADGSISGCKETYVVSGTETSYKRVSKGRKRDAAKAAVGMAGGKERNDDIVVCNSCEIQVPARAPLPKAPEVPARVPVPLPEAPEVPAQPVPPFEVPAQKIRHASVGGETVDKNAAAEVTKESPNGRESCKRTQGETSLSAGAKLYHGTLTHFAGAVRGPGWFGSQLPPFNKLAFHVPMAWMCFERFDYKVPGKFWLKELTLNADSKFPHSAKAAQFYDDEDEQTEEAREFCANCMGASEIGFILDEDAVDFEQEFILCNPSTSVTEVAEHEGSTRWREKGLLELDVGSFGTYTLDCGNPMGGFSVVTPPSTDAHLGGHAAQDPRRNSAFN